MSIIEADPPVATTVPATTNLTLKNAGPIKYADFQDLPTSGIIELRGHKGIGKSTILRTINHLATSGETKKKPPFSVHDGELNAQVEGFGVSMRLGGRQSHKGQLALVALGAVSVDELVDPGIDNAESADRARIEAIVQMTGQKADDVLFHPLVGGRDAFDRLLPGIAIGETNLVKLAGKIKRGLEQEARKSEAAAEQERGKALGAHEAAAGIDVALPCDEKQLGDALEQAISEKSSVDTRVTAADDSARSVAEARKSLDDAKIKFAGLPTVEEAKASEREALTAHEEADELVDRLKAQLKEAENRAEAAATAWTNAAAARASAESRQQSMQGWEAAVNATAVVRPSDDEIERAAKAVEAARDASNMGVKVREAKRHHENEEKHKKNAQSFDEDAKGLREAVKGIDGVLSEVVCRLGGKLQVEADRLILETSRGKTYFAELSDGERYEIGIDMLINQKGDGEARNGLGTIQQKAWGEIQPAVKKRLADYARAKGVLIVTAVVTDDEVLTAVAL